MSFFKNFKNNNHNFTIYNAFIMYFTEYRYWNQFFKLEKLVLEKHFNKLHSDNDVISILQERSLMRPLIPVWRLYPASLEIAL